MDHNEHHLRAYLEHRPQLIDFAAGIVGDVAGAEDVVQEAYLRFKSLPPDQIIEQPFFYLRRIVRNLALDALRKKKNSRTTPVADEVIDAIAEDAPSPERTLIGRQEVLIVQRAMAELPPRTRKALELYRFEGCKLAEIAQRLGISVTLAHTLVHDGIDHCRRRLAEPRSRS